MGFFSCVSWSLTGCGVEISGIFLGILHKNDVDLFFLFCKFFSLFWKENFRSEMKTNSDLLSCWSTLPTCAYCATTSPFARALFTMRLTLRECYLRSNIIVRHTRYKYLQARERSSRNVFAFTQFSRVASEKKRWMKLKDGKNYYDIVCGTHVHLTLELQRWCYGKGTEKKQFSHRIGEMQGAVRCCCCCCSLYMLQQFLVRMRS